MNAKSAAARDEAMQSAAAEDVAFALEAANACTWSADLRSGEVVLSEGWAVLMGAAPALTRTSVDALMALVPPSELAELKRAALEVMKGERERYTVEHRVRDARGDVKWILSRGRVIERDPASGRALRLGGINVDITERRRSGQHPRDSEGRFRYLTELSSDWYWEMDEGFRFTLLGGNFLEKTGIALDGYVGKALWEMPAEGVAQEAWERHKAALRRRETFRKFTVRWPEGLGSARWISMSGMPFHDADGAFKGYRGIARDITGEKAAEAAIAEARERLELALDAGRVSLWARDLPGRELFFDDRWTEMRGEARAPTLTTVDEWLDLLHPQDREQVAALGAETIKGLGAEFSSEFRILDARGEWRWVLARGRVTERDPVSGRARRVAGTSVDITEKKRLEERLLVLNAEFEHEVSERIAELEATLESVADCIAVIDLEGRLLRSNERFRAMCGVPLELVRGEESVLPHIAAHSAQPAEALAALGRCVADPGMPQQGTFALRDERVIEFASQPLTEGGTWSGVVLRFADVSHFRQSQAKAESLNAELADRVKERTRQLEAALAAANAGAAAKEAFLAAMSHEIRTPLNAVVGMIQLLRDSDLDEEQRECVRTIAPAGEALLRVVNDILDFSKIESGQVEMEEVEFDPAETIESVFQILAAQAREKRVELTYTMAERVPGRLRCDARRLHQIVLNLCANAVKFTRQGRVSVHVTSAPRGPGACELAFAVADTGIGIAPEVMPRLFKPFSQGDSSISRRRGGTGLGLAICARLCALMGGEIRVQSRPGAGSVFSFTVAAASAPGSAAEYPVLRGKTVLVVDDSEDVRRLYAMRLERLGMRVLTAVSGEQALAEFKRAAVLDAAVVDYFMPGMNGAELAEALHRQPRHAGLPIVLITTAEKSHPAINPARFFACLSKPVRTALLADTLQAALGGGSPMRVADSGGAETSAVGLRVLVVDDNDINRLVAVRMLQRLECVPGEASGGAQALELLAAESYDVVLMDLQMPCMDGLEAARLAIERFGAAVPRIVACTAHATEHDRQRCADAGMRGYLAKPYGLKELRDALVGSGYAQPGPGPGSARADILDHDTIASLRELYEGSPGTLGDLVDRFLQFAYRSIEAIAREQACGDLSSLQLRAHELKGAAAAVGAAALSSAALALERGAAAGDPGRERMPALRIALDDARTRLPPAFGIPCANFRAE